MRIVDQIWRLYLVSGVLLLAVLPEGFSQAVGEQDQSPLHSLTLRRAAEIALTQNPVLAVIDAQREGISAQVSEAKSSRYPFLQFGETYTHSNNPVFVFGSLLEQGKFGVQHFDPNFLNSPPSYSNFRSALNLRIPVFNKNQVDAQIEQAKLGGQGIDALQRYVQQQIRFEVVRAYFGILVAEAREAAADQAVETAEAERSRIADLVEQGIVVSSDLLATEVQLADFRRERIRAGGEVANAYAALNTVLGRAVDSQTTISGQLEDRTFGTPERSQMLRDALESRGDYDQLATEAGVRQQDIRSAKGQWLPDLNVFGQVGHSAQKLINGGSDFAVGATLTFNILDFGRSSRIEAAQAGRTVAQQQLRQKASEISYEVVEAYTDYLSSREQLAVANSAISQANEALRIVQDRHGAGLATITEVLNSQTALLRAKMNLLGARYQYYVGFAKTLLVTGKLDEVTPFIS
jgi:outer membrane protein TolC